MLVRNYFNSKFFPYLQPHLHFRPKRVFRISRILHFSYVNIKRPTCVVGQVYTKITIKPSIFDKRKISTHDSISADIV